MTRRYLDLELPEYFALQGRASDGSWIEWGRFRGGDFVRGDDGAYICAGEHGSPIFLRCISITGDRIECLDGARRPYEYRLTSL